VGEHSTRDMSTRQVSVCCAEIVKEADANDSMNEGVNTQQTRRMLSSSQRSCPLGIRATINNNAVNRDAVDDAERVHAVCGSTYVVVVPSENANDSPCLPVPDPNGLVVRAAEDPRVLVVEHRCADIVEVAKQGEQAPPLLVVPQLRRSGSVRVRM